MADGVANGYITSGLQSSLPIQIIIAAIVAVVVLVVNLMLQEKADVPQTLLASQVVRGSPAEVFAALRNNDTRSVLRAAQYVVTLIAVWLSSTMRMRRCTAFAGAPRLLVCRLSWDIAASSVTEVEKRNEHTNIIHMITRSVFCAG